MKKIVYLVVLNLLMVFFGCSQSIHKEITKAEKEIAGQQPFLNKIEYSNLLDKESQEVVKQTLMKAGVDSKRINLFLEEVDLFNHTVNNVGLVKDGFKVSDDLKVNYDIASMINQWQAKYPVFPGYNCRITTYGLLADFVDIKNPEVKDASNLFIDKDAIETSPIKLFNPQENEAFLTLFSQIQTDLHQDISKHIKRVKQNWKEKGINFIHDGDKSKASFIFVFFHSSFAPDDNHLFIGHVGVLAPMANDQLLFIEKLAFDEPYQVLKFNNRIELNDYLMNRYDVEWGQPTAKPFIMENDALLEGYRPNIHNQGEQGS